MTRKEQVINKWNLKPKKNENTTNDFTCNIIYKLQN